MIEGTVISASSNGGIAFATIGLQKQAIGTVTNQDGSFRFTVPEEYSNERITVRAIGFKQSSIKVSEWVKRRLTKIYLEEDTVMLQEVVILDDVKGKGRAKSVDLGNYVFNTGTMRLDNNKNGGAMALKISYPNTPFKVTRAKLRIRYSSLPSFKVRLRIMNVDEKTGLPGEDILSQNIIQESEITRGWLQFSLADYDLWMYEGSFFLVFEWILDNKDRMLLTEQILDHLQNDPESITASNIQVGEEQVTEKTISDFKKGIWFGSLLKYGNSSEYECYYRLNNLDSWKPSASIITAGVTITDIKDRK